MDATLNFHEKKKNTIVHISAPTKLRPWPWLWKVGEITEEPITFTTLYKHMHLPFFEGMREKKKKKIVLL